jgi:hypothetical protein
MLNPGLTSKPNKYSGSDLEGLVVRELEEEGGKSREEGRGSLYAGTVGVCVVEEREPSFC